MSFSHDRRGQSVVVGTVILFGFLILALSIYQVQFVPAENSEIEFEHSQEVEGDFLDLRNALLTAGRTGEARSTSIRLGTRYPQRTFFLNPPPASGELSTTGQNDLVIQDASVAGSDNIEDYWENRADGDGNIPFETRSVRYSPNYNEFQNGPDLLYEHSLVTAEFENTVLSRTGQTAVRGDRNRISLTMIDGDLSTSATERQSLDPETLSQQRRTVTLQPDDGTVTLVLPTAVESETKRNDLAEEWEEAIEAEVTTSVEDEAIRIEVKTEDSMQLALSQVGLGSGISETDESDGYITKISERDGVAVAEVRDRFNNPVEGAEVEIDINGDITPNKTDEEGRVEYTVETGQENVRMVINEETNGDWESVDFGLVGASTGEPGEARYLVEWLGEQIADENDDVEYFSGGNRLEVDSSAGRIDVSGQVTEQGRTLDGATVDFATTDRLVASFLDPDTEADEGDFSTDLDIENGGEATIFAASGDDVSGIDITVIDPPGTPSSPVNFVATDVAKGGNSQEFVFTVDGLGNDDQATIDLSGPQSDGVDYTNGAVELIEGTNPNDAVSYDPSTNTITYTKQGGGAGEVRIRISNIDVTGNAGETYVVEYADDDGNVDSDTFEIRPPGTTIVTQDTDDVNANGDIVIEDNVVIDGDVDSQNGEVIVGENAEIDGDVSANGDIVIGDNTFVGGEVDSQNGEVSVGDNAEIDDDVSANGDIVIGDDTFVDGDVDSQNGTVSLGSGTQVTGSVNANGNVDLGVGSLVEGDVTSQNGRVTLEDGSEVEGDVNVNSASDIVCGQGSRIDGQPCQEYVDENY